MQGLSSSAKATEGRCRAFYLVRHNFSEGGGDFSRRRFDGSRSGHKFEEEVMRLNKFQKNILGMQGVKAKVKDIDLRDYAKYLLKEGSPIEKREFLSCMKSKFEIARKIVAVEK